MKVEIKREEKFNPVTISLTFETEESLGLFSQLFNHAKTTNICDEFDVIWRELQGVRDKEGFGLFYKINSALNK